MVSMTGTVRFGLAPDPPACQFLDQFGLRRDQINEFLVRRFGHKHIILQPLSSKGGTRRRPQVNSYLLPTYQPLSQRAWRTHELVFDEIKTHQMSQHRILRSRTPDLVKQEIWGLLITHYATQG